MKQQAWLLACAMTAVFGMGGCHRADDDSSLAGAVATTTVPVATPPAAVATPVDATFDQMDTNQDGSLTPDELAATDALKQHFTDADTNGDGKLSAEEVGNYRSKNLATPPTIAPSSS